MIKDSDQNKSRHSAPVFICDPVRPAFGSGPVQEPPPNFFQDTSVIGVSRFYIHGESSEESLSELSLREAFHALQTTGC